LGNLFDWWKRETAVKFYEKTECFVRQYESILVKEAGVHLNGRLSLGENIADNGGVKTAYAV
jgi:predicted metalloendopeptidase